jgi:hypothetical protein
LSIIEKAKKELDEACAGYELTEVVSQENNEVEVGDSERSGNILKKSFKPIEVKRAVLNS